MSNYFIWFILSVGIGYLGTKRTIGFWLPFIVSLILTPLVGLLFILFFKKNAEDNPYLQAKRNFDKIELMSNEDTITIRCKVECDVSRLDVYDSLSMWKKPNTDEIRFYTESSIGGSGLVAIIEDENLANEMSLNIVLRSWIVAIGRDYVDIRIDKEVIEDACLSLFIAGIEHKNKEGKYRGDIIKEMNIGDRVFFKNEPSNPYDQFAVEILNSKNENIGYVPRNDSRAFSKRIKKGLPIIGYLNNLTITNDFVEEVRLSVFFSDNFELLQDSIEYAINEYEKDVFTKNFFNQHKIDFSKIDKFEVKGKKFYLKNLGCDYGVFNEKIQSEGGFVRTSISGVTNFIVVGDHYIPDYKMKDIRYQIEENKSGLKFVYCNDLMKYLGLEYYL